MGRRSTENSSDNYENYSTAAAPIANIRTSDLRPSPPSRSNVNDRLRAPPYSENPYLAEQMHNVQGEGEELSHHGTASFPPLQSQPTHASERASLGAHSHSTNPGNIGSSIRGIFRRSSTTSRPSQHVDGHEAKNHEEIQTADEYEKKMEDPQYLLNTIMEVTEEEESDKMIPIGEAAAQVSVSSDDQREESDRKEKRIGYRENHLRTKKLRRFTAASSSVAFLRERFNQIMSWALVIRIFVYWFPLALILFIPLAVGTWKNPNLEVGHTRVMWIFIWLEVVWGSLWVGKLFAHYMPEVFGFFISVFFPKQFKYVDMVLALELPIQLLIWTFVSFITFPALITNNPRASDLKYKWQHVVQNVCVAFLVSAIVFFIEQCFIYLISASFHRARMALRIANQKKSVNVLIILLSMAYSYFPRGCVEFEEEDHALQFVSLKRAQNLIRGKASKNTVIRSINQLVGHAAKNVQDFVAESSAKASKVSVAKIVKNALTRSDSREVLANRIWKSLVMEDSTVLTYEDLIGIFGVDKKEEVLFMFDILAKDNPDGITLDEMIESVHCIGREARQISKSLIDMNGAINKLHYLLMCICFILIIIIFVGMLAPASTTVIATLGSTLISLSWLFTSTAQEVFQSCIFLFVKHPFDIGDWVQLSVPSVGLVRMRVAEMNLMYTVFNQIGLNTRRQVSNSILNTLFIDNISRSPPSQISITIPIGVPETTIEQLNEFEYRLNEFVDANPREYAPGVYFNVIDQTELDRMSLSIGINTRNSQDDILLFSARRTKALQFIGRCINEIPITLPRRDETAFNDPAAPVFQYNIEDFDKAMEYAEKAKGKRRNAGLQAPKTDDCAVEEENAANNESNNSNAKQTNAETAHRLSMSSRRSQAFSSTSRTTNVVGLRSRRQQPYGADGKTSAAATVDNNL